MNGANQKMLEGLLDRTDPKQFSLVGLQALCVLGEVMNEEEFKAFLHDATKAMEKAHIMHMGERVVSQQELNRMMTAGRIKDAVSEDDSTVRLIGPDGNSVGRFKTPLPFVAKTGE